MRYVRRAPSTKPNTASADEKSWLGIDQKNVNERNHQVGFMDQIYSSARSVRICIRDSSLTASSLDYNRLFSWLRNRGSESYTDIETSRCLDLHHLLSRRYFSRVWVIQEVALAREVCLHVNNHMLLFDSTVMGRMEHLCKKNGLEIPSALKWSTCRTIEAGIAACLQAAMNCNATDPRDEVYAVLSLMEPQARSLIPVDYSLDLESIWGYAIAAIIITQGNLAVLSHVGVHHHTLSLDYTGRRSSLNRTDIAAYLAGLISSKPHHLTSPYSEKHCATPWHAQLVVLSSEYPNTSQQPATFSIIGSPMHPSLLPRFCVRAHYIDCIDVVEVRSSSFDTTYVESIPSYDVDGVKLYQYQSVPVIHGWDQKPFDQIKSKDIRPLIVFFKEDKDNVSTADPYHSLYTAYDPEALIRSDSSLAAPDLLEFINVCRHSRNGRPLFTTRFSIGFTGSKTEGYSISKRAHMRGDRIFAIDGARTPFILRSSSWLLVNKQQSQLQSSDTSTI